MNGIFYIILGILIGGYASGANRRIESQRPLIFVGPIGELLMLIGQLAGPGLVIYGIYSFFS
jgi:hypothetical protein